ncbi:PREDICTED: ankyrin repeat domain-containing protein 29-like [Priapulus caudatus]|uniref:Ankyrin repeat domain-containing protein 29-like n=1 Tax=Priapulus caudatus TaxID=37621 RepID=A0ABM1EME8_PRICU|nr:PREDICTED: ankyrin repeat domain-containing protein 29-like [Priapulus caudatus]
MASLNAKRGHSSSSNSSRSSSILILAAHVYIAVGMRGESSEGTTPLILAAANNHADCVNVLLEHGAEPNARRLTGTCALFFAAQGGFIDIVRLLLDSGTTIDTASYDGGTPLFVACQCNHIEVVEEMLKRGADIHAEMADGATPLFKAAHKGNLECVEELVKYGANLGALENGESALHAAALFGHMAVVKHLMVNGSIPDLKNKDGFSPIDLAKDSGYGSIADYLRKCRHTTANGMSSQTAV